MFKKAQGGQRPEGHLGNDSQEEQRPSAVLPRALKGD